MRALQYICYKMGNIGSDGVENHYPRNILSQVDLGLPEGCL